MEVKDMGPGNLPILSAGSTLLVALISIAFGLLNCFFGYRIFRVLLGVYGFLLGALVGFTIASTVTGGQILWLIVGAIVGGILGAVLMVLAFFVGVFVFGALAGAALANTVGAIIGIDVPTLVVVIVAVVVGVVALIAQRAVIILITAFGGAWATVTGGAMLFAGESLPGLDTLAQPATWQQAGWPMLVILLVWLALGLAGAIVQFRTTTEQPAAAPQV
jgi:hypothetical protein